MTRLERMIFQVVSSVMLPNLICTIIFLITASFFSKNFSGCVKDSLLSNDTNVFSYSAEEEVEECLLSADCFFKAFDMSMSGFLFSRLCRFRLSRAVCDFGASEGVFGPSFVLSARRGECVVNLGIP
jgi:hypothetical protein